MSVDRKSDGTETGSDPPAVLLRQRLGAVRIGRWGALCPYLPGRVYVHVGVLYDFNVTRADYEWLLAHNFRRTGEAIYAVSCRDCSACRSLRVPVDRFRPSRSQRRCWRRNTDLSVHVYDEHLPTVERYRLYERYVQQRHGDVPPWIGMTGSLDEFVDFLCTPSHALPRCVEFRERGRLLAVGVYDDLPNAYSAVYCYFEPNEPRRSLGTLNILWLIEHARQTGRRHVYLGYYVAGCRKMNYKARFRPCEIWVPGKGWQLLQSSADCSGPEQDADHGPR